jgi:hypothetical protein
MAIVNANMEFIMADVGCNGRVSDGGVIEETAFYSKLKSGKLYLPKIEETVNNLNFVFVGDDAFALRDDLIKPFPQKNLSYEIKVFNYRLSRAGRVVENAFGILGTRFRVFHTAIHLKPSKIEDIVLASVVLHNYLRRECRLTYTPIASIDSEEVGSGTVIPGEWRRYEPMGNFQGLQVCLRKQN